jgi:hypothetical protein
LFSVYAFQFFHIILFHFSTLSLIIHRTFFFFLFIFIFFLFLSFVGNSRYSKCKDLAFLRPRRRHKGSYSMPASCWFAFIFIFFIFLLLLLLLFYYYYYFIIILLGGSADVFYKMFLQLPDKGIRLIAVFQLLLFKLLNNLNIILSLFIILLLLFYFYYYYFFLLFSV